MDNNDIRQSVSVAAQRIFEAKHQIPLRILFLWYKTFTAEIQVDQLAVHAAHLIEEYIPKEISGTNVITREELSITPLNEFIYSISVTRFGEGPSIWAAGELLPSVDLLSSSSRFHEAPIVLNAGTSENSQPSDEDYKRTILMRHIMKMVPQERQLEMLRLIQEIRRDMKPLSLKDFMKKWELQD